MSTKPRNCHDEPIVSRFVSDLQVSFRKKTIKVSGQTPIAGMLEHARHNGLKTITSYGHNQNFQSSQHQNFEAREIGLERRHIAVTAWDRRETSPQQSTVELLLAEMSLESNAEPTSDYKFIICKFKSSFRRPLKERRSSCSLPTLETYTKSARQLLKIPLACKPGQCWLDVHKMLNPQDSKYGL